MNKPIRRTILFSVFLLITPGSNALPVKASEAISPPLDRDTPVQGPSRLPKDISSSKIIEEPTGNLSLQQALALALQKNPALAVSSWELRSGEARSIQAGLFPNPELEVEVDEFGGSREVDNPDGTTDKLRRFDGAETRVVLNQLFELGGKRSKRKRVADLERNLLQWDFETTRLDIIAETTTSFIDLLSLQERLLLTEGLVRISQDVFNTVSERVEAGKVSPVEKTRAQVALSTMEIEREKAKRALEAGRKRLAALWGNNSPVFQRVEGNLNIIATLPSYESIIKQIPQNPDIARWDTEIKQREAVLHLEKAERYPNLTIAGGIKYLNESNDETYIMGMSLPLPFLNRNQGGILEASYNLRKAREERTAAEVKTIAELDDRYQALLIAYTEAITLRDTILPAAESAFKAADEGYFEGKFSYLEVLDAQRSLFQAKGTYLESLAAYHKALAAIERLIGKKLDPIK